MNAGILNGLRVLDFTRALAGPYVTRCLADFGAEVIKVQSKRTEKSEESNLSEYFCHWNRNKRSITLDLNYQEARQIVLKLAEVSDVVVENFSPRVMSNWGLNYEKLRLMRSDLIMLSMSGMGHNGPWKDLLAFAPTVQSLGGLTYLTSFSHDCPIGLGYSYADVVSGLYGALGILAALEHRDRTGQGQHIDLSEYEVVCTLIGPALLDVFANGKDVFPQGNRSPHVPAAPYGCYKCRGKDRWCVIAVFDDDEWKALCRALGNPPWAHGKRFSTLPERKEHLEELDELLERWTTRRTAEDVVQILQKAGVPAGVVQNAQDLASDPHLMERQAFAHLKHPVLGNTMTDNYPMKLEASQKDNWRPAPLLGEDNAYVCMELLGLSEAKFSSYIEQGIIG